jgi:hypothetical protein
MVTLSATEITAYEEKDKAPDWRGNSPVTCSPMRLGLHNLQPPRSYRMRLIST